MKYTLEINMETEKIDIFKIVPVYNHMDTQHKEHIGWARGQDKENILNIIRKEAFSHDESLYEIFVGMSNVEIELLAVSEDKKIRVAVHACWLRGKNRDMVINAIKALDKGKKDKVDLEADFVENGVGSALNK